MLVQLIYKSVPFLSFAIVAIGILFIVHPRLKSRFRRHAIYTLAVLALGPGLLIHYGIKEHYCRPRPEQITIFGGDKQFSPAFKKPEHCLDGQKSFVSGHASIGFMVYVFSYISTYATRRILWTSLGTLCGLGIGLGRILQGRHFLSDVIFAGFVVYYTAYALHVAQEKFLYPLKAMKYKRILTGSSTQPISNVIIHAEAEDPK